MVITILHKSVDINFIFCRHCYARGGERVPGAVRKYIYTSLDDTIVASYCNYNAALMMILCFSGDIIHLFPYRKSGITFIGICECNICLYRYNCISDFCSGILVCSLSDAAAAEAAARVLVRVPAPRRATGEEGGKEEEEGMEGEKLKKFQVVKRARKQEGVARKQELEGVAREQEGAEKVAQ